MLNRTKRKTTSTARKSSPKSAPPSRLKWTEERTQQFIEAVVEFCGNVTRALLKVGMGQSSFYARCREDSDFERAVTEARDRGVDVGEDRLRDRAYKGVARYELYQGEIVYLRDSLGRLINKDGKRLKRGEPAVPIMRIEYSDAVAIRIMEAYRLRYRTRRHEMTGAEGGAIQTKVNIYIPDNGRVPKGAAGGRRRRRTGRS